MTITEAMEKRDDLRDQIMRLVNEFEASSGMRVEEIRVAHIALMPGAFVEVAVQLGP